MSGERNWLSRIVEVGGIEPEDARRRRLLNTLLLAVAVSAILILVVVLIAAPLGFAGEPGEVRLLHLSVVVTLGGAVILYLLNRYVSGELASTLFLLLLIAVAIFSDEPQQVVNGRGLLVFAVPILAASALLRPWASIVVAALCSVAISVMGVVVVGQDLPNLPAITAFFVLALISWFSARSLEGTLESQRAGHSLLEASESRLITAQHIARMGDFTWDVETGQVTWSDGLFELLGYDRSEAIDYARVNAEIRHPDDLERVTQWLTDSIASGRTELPAHEYRVIRKDGETIHIGTQGVIQREEGKSPRVFATVQDITERKLAEEALRTSEQRLRSFINNSPDTIYIYDLVNRELIYLNRDEFCGYSREEVTGNHSVLSAVHPDDLESVRRQWESLRQAPGDEVDASEYRLQTKSGEWDWIRDRRTIISRDAEGAPAEILVTLSVITERRHAEEALRESEAKMRSIFRAAPIGIGVVSDRLIHEVNQRFCAIVGYARDELIGQGARMVYASDEDYEYVGERKYDQIEKWGTGSVETRMRRKDGEIIDVLLRSTPLDPTDLSAGVTFTVLDITERRHAEEALREERNRAQRYLDTAGVILLALDAEGVVTLINRKGSEVLGYDQAEIVGKSWFDNFLPAAQRDRVRAVFDGVMAGDLESFERYENAVINSAGEERIIAWYNTMLRDDAGNPVGIFSSGEDITERKQAELALRESEERLRLAISAANQGLYDYNVQTGETRINDEYALMLGYEPGELEETNAAWIGRLHPDDRAPTTRAYQDYLSGKIPEYRVEYRQRAKSGDWVWVLSVGKIAESDAGGEPLRMLGTHTNITERKRADAERERLILAIEQVAEIVVITDIAGAIQYVNPAFERVTGYTSEEAVGQTHGFLESGKQDDAFYRDLWDTLGRGETWNERFVNRRKDGTLYTVVAVISPVRDASGKTVNYVAVERDITEEIKLEEQLRQAQKMEAVGRLAGGVAHDFNNMLQAILGYTGLALDQVDPAEQLHADLREVEKAARRSADLTRQLLAFARRQTVSPKVLDLNESVAGMLKMLRRLIGEDIDLAWLPGAGLWQVRIDPSQIDQILANLCVNARDAIAGVGEVSIETENVHLDRKYCDEHVDSVPGDYVQLTVSDTGRGMDRETLAHVFEPFFTTKGPGEGTGMGLSTVYGIVRQNRGSVTIYSEPGLGTTFKIYLPRHVDKAELLDSTVPASPDARGHETVLLVEDEESILILGRRMLEELGYRVLTAWTPGEAIALAEEHAGEIHLLMTDVVMPEMNGRDLARKLLSLYPDLKRLFMSGYTADVIAHRGVLDEGVHFLQKPFTMAGLAVRVRQALDQK